MPSCRALSGLAALVLLTGCAKPLPPVVSGPLPALPYRPAPSWLPAGWVEDGSTAVLTLGHADHVYTPADAAAPLLQVAWFSASEARAWPTGEPLDYLLKQVSRSLQEPGLKTPAPKPWTRADLAAGWRFELREPWREGDRGRLEGVVAVGRSVGGHFVQAAVLIPAGSDRAGLSDLLARVPAEP